MDIEGKLPETNAAHVTVIEGENGTADSAELSAHKPKDTSKLKKVFEDDGYNKMNEAIGRMLKRLRKEHNMTVKDVKQRLHDDYGVDVAEKTLYNWERDEGTPELSLIPVIAEIFGVSCDELLRGERRSPEERAEHADASVTGITPKGARERKRILDVGMARYKNQTFVAMGIAVLGLIVAMICNLCLLVPIVAFLAAAIFYLVAVVCEAVFINIAFCTVSGDEMEENDVMQFRYRVCMLAEICFGLVIVLFASCVPLLASEVGLLWELYWDLGWLFSGVACAVPALLIYLIILYFVNAALLRKGIYRKSQGSGD